MASSSRAVSPALKTERLLNLVICLLSTRRPLSKQDIRKAVPQYGDAASDESFDRMFERDKDELRDIGIPLRTEPLDAYFDDEPGYRIDQREYALPDIAFETDELAVLGLAARTWQQASLGGAAAQAMRKLRVHDVDREVGPVVTLEPRVRTTEPAFEPIKDAALQRRMVAFSYRKGVDAPAQARRLQPWAVASWHGHWYVTGFDLDRDAPRVFRLSRVVGKVKVQGPAKAYDIPEGHDAMSMIATNDSGRSARTAVVRVRAGAGNTLRRRASEVVAVDDDWDQLTLAHHDVERLVSEVCGFGPSAVAISPTELVEGVRARLAALVAAQEGSV
ncbi:helix-turn-helix transcriptional regulator [Demetria terragena]|uniref:helix-turn-helix transcriptional regulator n=1 Tax=Demetria terragena TaxID=63959 RepID=UPI00037C38C6|nr:WYL domain-containing protein [Demetria terragena]